MLGHYGKRTFPEWGIWAMILAVVLVAAVFYLQAADIGVPIFQSSENAVDDEAIAISQAVTVDTLRAAKPDFTGGYVPESTMGEPAITVDILQAAKPDFTGGYVPESTMGEPAISADTLRAAKPDFTGGYVPESTMGEPAITVDILRAAKPDFTGGYVPESTMMDDSR